MEGLVFSQHFALEPNGPKRLEVRRDVGWNQVDIRIDGHDLGTTDGDTLKDTGLDYALPDETLLHVWLESDFRGAIQFFATRDGKPIPGSGADPKTAIHPAAALILVAGVPQLALAIGLAVAGRPQFLLLGGGLGMTALGFFAWAGSFTSLLWGGVIALVEITWFFMAVGTFHDAPDLLRLGLTLMLAAFALIRGLAASRR